MRKHDVFISFKNLDESGQPTPDCVLATVVFEFLCNRGLRVFFSNRSLEILGASEYKREIDKALDESLVLVAVGKKRSNIESRWVQYEWESFYNDILSGLCPNKRLFSYVDDMKPEELPRTLRQNQSIAHAADGATLISLGNFVENALSAATPTVVRMPRRTHDDPEIAGLDVQQRLAVGILCWDMGKTDILDDSVRSFWTALPRLARRAYMNYSEQVIDTLANIGYTLKPIRDKAALLRLTPEQLDVMGQYDHQIWLARKRELGWNYGPASDVSRKRSPYLIPWAELPLDIREHGLELARSLPIALAASWLQVVSHNATA